MQHGAGFGAMSVVEAKLEERKPMLRRIKVCNKSRATVRAGGNASWCVIAVTDNFDLTGREILHEDLPTSAEQQTAFAKNCGVTKDRRATGVVVERTNQLRHDMSPPMCCTKACASTASIFTSKMRGICDEGETALT
jgi:hypothetical protein